MERSHENMTVLDIVFALNNTSDDTEIRNLIGFLEEKSNLNESNTQQHLYAYLNGVVLSSIRPYGLKSSVISDMEIRSRIYEDHSGNPRCALGVAIIPTPEMPIDSSLLLNDICSEIRNRNLDSFVNDVTVNDTQMFWGDGE